jgi:hypothetical protein
LVKFLGNGLEIIPLIEEIGPCSMIRYRIDTIAIITVLLAAVLQIDDAAVDDPAFPFRFLGYNQG